jgi:phosphate/sulfate permease
MEDLSNPTVQNREPENEKPAGQAMGIAALITAIITFVMAVIPCIGIIAIIPGIIAIVLAGVGLSQASRNDSPRGILVASMIIGVIASLIAFSQIFIAGKITKNSDKWGKNIQNIVDEVQKDVIKDLENSNISIKVENGDKKVEITTNVDKKDREQTLEELEKGNAPADDSLVQKK